MRFMKDSQRQQVESHTQPVTANQFNAEDDDPISIAPLGMRVRAGHADCAGRIGRPGSAPHWRRSLRSINVVEGAAGPRITSALGRQQY